ncbi:MAG: threonine--tRNA ligase [bacterium]|nr:threonine--tRNA ligase [bacterium]
MAKEKNNLEVMRHSLSHVLAMAVLDMFPEGKLAIGPAIDNGFYYDFDLPRTLIPEDLPLLEKKMKHIVKQNLKFERQDVPITEALKIAKKANQPYKTELIKDLEKAGNTPNSRGKKSVSFYKTGEFIDLCEGPHVDSTNKLGIFKLSHTAGAYWKGDEKNKMLQRIYAYAFETQQELDEYLKNLEEARNRDHKKIGQALDLFSFHAEAPGSAFWHPKGMIIWNELESLGKSVRKKYGNEEIQTPILAKNTLWKTSGHWDHYKEDMFHFKVEKETYVLKPMDCPFNIKIYQEKLRSYRDLPVRYTEIGRVLRNEKSGQLNGLFRVRHITQDDAHIFCTKEQVESEIETLIKMVKEYYKIFDIKPQFYFSTRPDNFMGEKKDWDKAEKNLENALRKEKISYETKENDGAFYGPKIDIDIEDALGRKWQLATIQLDFQLPERFGLEYIAENGSKKTPVMIHAAIFGSLERFIGILTEHYNGNFPLWLAPVQVKVIPVSEKFEKFARGVESELKNADLRVELDDSDESVGKKIRNAEMQKIPYMLVLGEKEVKSKKIAVRSRKNGDLGQIDTKKLIEKLTKEIKEKE